MTRATILCWSLAVLMGLPGRAAFSSNLPPAANAPSRIRRGILFVVDGAGGFEAASRTIRQTATEACLPLEVHPVRWTHGYCRVAADQMHAAHLHREGRKLAEQVLRCRCEAPAAPIFLMAHSAGCGVVLAAAENLPPNTLERIILLAPAVSATHDLRSALRSACQGIDVFTSSRDWACLGIGTFLAGTTDRCWLTPAAGKTGFRPLLVGAQDEAVYSRLRQHPWTPSLSWTGHKGGHYGSYQPAFLRTFVLPLLTSSLGN